MIVGLVHSSNLHCLAKTFSIVLNQTTSFEASWRVSNSTWLVEVAITICLTDFHEMVVPFFRNMYHVWDFPVVSSVLKPEFVYPMVFVVSVFLKWSPKSSVILKYRIRCLTPFQCLIVGFWLCVANMLVANVISGLVWVAKYINAPTVMR